MNEPIRILFDENFGEPLVHALAAFLALHEEKIEICHLFRFAKPSEVDEVWVPKIKPGGWTVITTDRGKQCGGQKLPNVCCENEVTHILLSASLHGSKQFEKIRAIVAALPEIILATQSARGSRFSLKYDGPDKRVILTAWPVKTISSAGVPLPRLGFSGRQKRVRRYSRPSNKKIIPVEQRLFKDFDGR